MTPLEKAVALQLRSRRVTLGLSYVELAAGAGASPAQVSQIMRGVRPCTIGQLEAFSIALGVTALELLSVAAASS